MSSNIEELIVDNDDFMDDAEYSSGDNIIIMNICLVSEMYLDLDSTIECTHYKPKSEVKVPFFKHM